MSGSSKNQFPIVSLTVGAYIMEFYILDFKRETLVIAPTPTTFFTSSGAAICPPVPSAAADSVYLQLRTVIAS